jgi:hypothetical protein
MAFRPRVQDRAVGRRRSGRARRRRRHGDRRSVHASSRGSRDAAAPGAPRAHADAAGGGHQHSGADDDARGRGDSGPDARCDRPEAGRSTAGADRPAAAAAAGAASSASRFGGVRLACPIELQVFENNTLLGSSSTPIAVNEGAHQFDLVNELLGFRVRQTATVKSGQMTNLTVPIPDGRVSINAVPWADVVIDGTPAGQTPIANLSLRIGQHEVVFRHPQLGEQKQTVTVKTEGLTRVSAVLQK